MPIPPDTDLLAQGTYARKQIFCKSRVVAWSHRGRFDLARRLVSPYAGARLLDYGCGDGTFLGLVRDLFPEATGADVDRALVADCARRFAGHPGLSFVQTGDLTSRAGAFDVVMCMEVLEHCLEPERVRVLGELRRLVAGGGVAIVSVPIETGPSLPAKQAMRALAAWRGLGDYRHRETYSPTEMVRMLFAGRRGAVPRVTYVSQHVPGETLRYYGHKGFNWRVLADEAQRVFDVERPKFSPLRHLGPWLNSQAWLICRPR